MGRHSDALSRYWTLPRLLGSGSETPPTAAAGLTLGRQGLWKVRHVHQAAAGTAGHPLYLADGLQWRYLRRAIAEGADVVKFFGLNHEICGRGSVAEYFYILGRWASLVSSWWCA